MATQDKNILKGLQSQANKMKAKIDLDQSDLVNKQRLLSYKRKALKDLKDKIDSGINGMEMKSGISDSVDCGCDEEMFLEIARMTDSNETIKKK